MLLRKIGRGLLDAIYPPICALCGQLSTGIHPHCCESCFHSFEAVGDSCCPRCGEPFPVQQEPHLCLSCLISPPSFNWCRGIYLYRGNLAEALGCFKYGKELALLKPLVDAVERGSAFHCFPDVDMVVPVPVSRRVLYKRGFNCAAQLAKPLGRSRGLPVVENALSKVGSLPQVGLGRRARRKNAAGSFSVGRGIKAVAGKRVLLFDDVYTTGSTVRACTRILTQAGADVSVLTLARAGKTVVGQR